MRAPKDTSTIDLFDLPQAPELVEGSLNYAAELIGQDISKYQLDAWTAESREGHRFPFEYAAAFEVACETTALQELLARKRGSRVLAGEDAILTELGRIEKQKVELAVRERLLKERIRGRR